MKGLMVALLTIGLTGMVSGQQPQNSSNGYGGQLNNSNVNNQNGNQGNSQFQRLAQNPSAANANSAKAESFGPLQIGFRETDFDAFKRAGEMSSPIGASDVASVNSVIFFHEKFADQQASLGDSFGRLEPVSRDGGVLIFELDDLDLNQIRTQGMRYNYSAQERGFYNTIKAKYRPSGQSGQQLTTRREPAQTDNRRVDSTRLTPLGNGTNNNQFGSSNYPDNRFASNNYSNGTTQPNSQQQSNFNPNVPREYDQNFMGPTRPPTSNDSNFVNSNQNNRFDSGLPPRRTTQYDLPGTNQGQANMAGNSNGGLSGNLSNNPTGWSPIPNQGNQVSTRMGGSLNDFGNNSNYQPIDNRNNNFSSPGQQQFDSGTNQNGYNQNQIAPLAPGSQFTNNLNPNDNNQGQVRLSDLEREQQQIAYLKTKAMEEKLALEKRELADLEQANLLRQKSLYQQQLQQQQQRTENQWAGNNQRPAYENSGNSFNQFDNGPPQDRLGYTPTGGYTYSDRLTNTNGYGSPPDRYAASGPMPQLSGSSISDYSAAVPGPGNINHGGVPNGPGNKLNQSSLMGDSNAVSMEGPMFFMLICSLGLNIYLGWISRSFYVRYNELADELRETFTASM